MELACITKAPLLPSHFYILYGYFPHLSISGSEQMIFNMRYSLSLGVEYLFCVCVCLFRAAPVAYGSSQARGQTGAVAASLCHSHSNARSKLCLRLTLQLMATPDP